MTTSLLSHKIAIIDLGTNTFQLLIVSPETSRKGFSVLHRDKAFVQLGENGVQHIGDAAFERGITTFRRYAHTITQWEISDVYAMATEALRRADNGQHFIEQVLRETNIQIHCISGELEAELIYYGIRQTLTPTLPEPFLLIDIGGGSTEFIIATHKKILWAQSFPLGVAVLRQQFQQNENAPTSKDVETLHSYLNQLLQSSLVAQIQHWQPQCLIGSSGSFDTFADLIRVRQKHTHKVHHLADLPLWIWQEIGFTLKKSTLDQRLGMKGMEPRRAEMIVLAYLLTEWVLEKSKITALYQSDFAIKEGILWCILHQPEVLVPFFNTAK